MRTSIQMLVMIVGLIFPIQIQVTANSQQTAPVEVSGTVSDETGAPLPGASVLVVGTGEGTITGLDGRFSVNVNPGDRIRVSFIGYATQEFPITASTELLITLLPGSEEIEELVVIGYGTQKKADLTSAISVVETESIESIATSNVADAIQGSAPGVSVRSTGRPDGEAIIEIRGVGTIGNNNPLYVIDGLPTIAGRDFNVNDIESIQILKDAAAASIYGNRAANGVIIITTKKGRSGEIKVDYSGSLSSQWMPRYDLANREEYIYLNNMSRINAGAELQGHFDGTKWAGTETDWQDAFFKQGMINDHNMTFSGGNDAGTYLVSMNYYNNTGTVHDNWFKRYSLRINTSMKKGIFELGENLQITNSNAREVKGNPFWQVLKMAPTIPLKNPDNPGGWGYGDIDHAATWGTNQRAYSDIERTYNSHDRVRGNLYGQLNFTNWVYFRSSLGLEASRDQWENRRKLGNIHLGMPYWPTNFSQLRGSYNKLTFSNILNMDRQFGRHMVNLMLGSEYTHMTYDRVTAGKTDLAGYGEDHIFWVLDAGTENTTAGGFRTENAMISYFTRLNYNFNEKYYLGATIRRDGNSKLPLQNRWANFPSLSAGWKISNESFFPEPDWLSSLKIRLSYGKVGNVNIGDWDYISFINYTPEAVLGVDQYSPTPGATQVKLANDDLRWEAQVQRNLGIDAALFNNRLTFTGDYYISNTHDVLIPVPLLVTTGNDLGDPIINAASLENKGVELNLGWKEQRGDFSYDVNLNFTKMTNRVTDLGTGNDAVLVWLTKTVVGEPVGQFFILETDGLFQSMEEVESYVGPGGLMIQPDAKPGDIRYMDVNGRDAEGKLTGEPDGQINDDDRQFLGSPWPDFQLGILLSASYKNFDFSLNGYGQFGNDVMNGNTMELGLDNDSNYKRGTIPWTPENPDTESPRLLWGDDRNSLYQTDRWLEDGSFFRIKQFTLGYTLPGSLVDRIGFESMRVSVTGQNLVTFTNYSGLDPDFQGLDFWMRGIEGGAFPGSRTVTGAIRFVF